MVSPAVNQQVKIVFGRYTAVKAIQERGALNNAIRDAITASLKDDSMIIIESVQLENIEFSTTYLQSIEQRMLAEVEVQKLQQNAEREKVQAQITVTQANAKANAVRAEAQASADALRLNGEARATNIKLTGEAEAAAIEPAPRRSAPTRTSSPWCRPSAGTACCRPPWCPAPRCRSSRSNNLRKHPEAVMPGIAISASSSWGTGPMRNVITMAGIALAFARHPGVASGDAASQAAENFDGLWARTAKDCRNKEGPDSKTLIDMSKPIGGKPAPMVDQYENHCRIDRKTGVGDGINLSVTCFEFWDYFNKGVEPGKPPSSSRPARTAPSRSTASRICAARSGAGRQALGAARTARASG